MKKQIGTVTIDVNEEGFMTDFSQWNKNVGIEIAKEANINLTPRHWQVLDYIQDEYRHEVPLTIRKIGKSGVVDVKEFYELFPKAPLKTATKIAGVPKPAGCI